MPLNESNYLFKKEKLILNIESLQNKQDDIFRENERDILEAEKSNNLATLLVNEYKTLPAPETTGHMLRISSYNEKTEDIMYHIQNNTKKAEDITCEIQSLKSNLKTLMDSEYAPDSDKNRSRRRLE